LEIVLDDVEMIIVIPCYNEYNRLPIADFTAFLSKHPQIGLCFVNDASTDQTEAMLLELQASFLSQILVLRNTKNLGKAGSVRHGILHCHSTTEASTLAYLDADLATSLEECVSYTSYLNDTTKFVFASRILKIGSVVERKFSRFISGRIIATLISNLLDIKVYDTQCGCKVFQKDLAAILFQKTFISKWLFDVELFSRLLVFYGKEDALQMMNEIPVKRWVDQGDSKVKLSYFFRLWYDLYLIRKNHSDQIKSKAEKIA